MVQILPDPLDSDDTLRALLVTQLSDGELQKFKLRFEKGSNVHLKPMLHLKIVQAPQGYLTMTHAEMRTAETEAGNEDAFVVIDRNVVEKGAVWYVDQFADESDVECGYAANETIVMEALVRTEHVAISRVNWVEGNLTIVELLEELDEKIMPLGAHGEQSEPLGADDEGDETWSTDEITIIAEAEEYEVTADQSICSNMSPTPREAVRLLPSVAQREHLISDWTWPRPVDGSEPPESNADGDSEGGEGEDEDEDDDEDDDEDNNIDKENNDEDEDEDGGEDENEGQIVQLGGRIRMSAKLDPSFPIVQYEWPEGSL